MSRVTERDWWRDEVEPDNPYQHLFDEGDDPDPDSIPEGAPPTHEKPSKYRVIERHLFERGHFSHLERVQYGHYHNIITNQAQHDRDLERIRDIERRQQEEAERRALKQQIAQDPRYRCVDRSLDRD